MHGIIDYIKDNDYRIILFNNSINIKNYKELKLMNDKEIIIKLIDRTLTIKGNSFTVKRLEELEILIEGKILNIEIRYE